MKFSNIRRRVAVGLAASAALAIGVSTPVCAQQVFPDHPVQIVVPYVPGGLTDNIARYFASRLKDGWNQPVVVDNKPGASATLGAATPTGRGGTRRCRSRDLWAVLALVEASADDCCRSRSCCCCCCCCCC